MAAEASERFSASIFTVDDPHGIAKKPQVPRTLKMEAGFSFQIFVTCKLRRRTPHSQNTAIFIVTAVNPKFKRTAF
jgi:hypothetical protein